MLFEREDEALAWYEKQERVLTPQFLTSIPWQDIGRHELKSDFVPVILYMRDIEKYTAVYYDELLHTPTGKDPVIRRFMDRWSNEESLHGDLLDRFLNEAGFPTSHKWFEEFKSRVPRPEFFMNHIRHLITNCFGKHFSAVHMTWGAINELTTLSGYERLWQRAGHPVLEYLLRAIAREEARHSFFYWSIARIKLAHSEFRQKLTRYIINQFWIPVGQGTKSISETNYLIKTLFGGEAGLNFMDQQVNRRIRELPGLAGLHAVTERIAQTSLPTA